jgi:hypothetical protein
MSKKCISFIVLFTFLHYSVAGCVKKTTMQQEKLYDATMECITCEYEVVLTTGEKFKFKKPNVRVVSHLITGTLNDGRNFFLDLADEDIKEIRISTEQTISRVDLANNPDQRIYEIMVGANIYTFDKNGGKLKADVKTIHGIIKSGEELDVPIEDILHVKVKHLHLVKSGLLAVGYILLVVGAGVILLLIKGFG